MTMGWLPNLGCNQHLQLYLLQHQTDLTKALHQMSHRSIPALRVWLAELKKKKFCSIILIYNGKDFEFYHYITSKDLKFNKNHKIKIFLKEESWFIEQTVSVTCVTWNGQGFSMSCTFGEIRVKYIDKNWIFYQSVNPPLMPKEQSKKLSSKVII